jgi:two-component system KDP operon response regulator KdpE
MTGATTQPALRILAVDDDPAIRSLIRAILARADDLALRGAVVLEAATLAEARRLLASETINLLLLDVHLPDGLGLDLAAELRGDIPDRPAILALTASVLPADQQAALDAGCDAFLAKPYSAMALVSTCSELVMRRARAIAARTVQP